MMAWIVSGVRDGPVVHIAALDDLSSLPMLISNISVSRKTGGVGGSREVRVKVPQPCLDLVGRGSSLN
jgi:hypothetical protein